MDWLSSLEPMTRQLVLLGGGAVVGAVLAALVTGLSARRANRYALSLIERQTSAQLRTWTAAASERQARAHLTERQRAYVRYMSAAVRYEQCVLDARAAARRRADDDTVPLAVTEPGRDPRMGLPPTGQTTPMGHTPTGQAVSPGHPPTGQSTPTGEITAGGAGAPVVPPGRLPPSSPGYPSGPVVRSLAEQVRLREELADAREVVRLLAPPPIRFVADRWYIDLIQDDPAGVQRAKNEFLARARVDLGLDPAPSVPTSH